MAQATNNNSPIEGVRFISQQAERKKENNNVDFLMVMNGEVSITNAGTTIYMNKNDVIMVDFNDKPVLNASGNNMLMIISIRQNFFIDNGIDDMDVFICNSVKDTDRDYGELRRILSSIAIAYNNTSEVSVIRQNELCYSLLYYLMSYHYVSGRRQNSKKTVVLERKETIIDYLERNYMNPVTLAELSELTHINGSYLCRYFKMSTGTTFNGYLKRIRLRHSIQDLLETDKSITSIAYECGFSSPATFCKVFAEEYGETPSKYRKHHSVSSLENNAMREIKALSESETNQRSIEYKYIESELQKLTEGKQNVEFDRRIYPSQKNIMINDAFLSDSYLPPWNKLINLGYGRNVINSEFQKQLGIVQKEIGFIYGRIEGMLNEDILPTVEDTYNYAEFDRIIGIMLANDIKPYMDLALRGANLLLPGKEEVLYRNYESKSFNQFFLKKVQAVIKHCVNHYGIDEVNTWAFDIGIYHNEKLRLVESPKVYVKRAKSVMNMLREYLPDALIGGVTYNGGMRYGTFESIIKEMSSEGFRPDFISTCIFPYEPIGVLEAEMRKVSSDPEHVKNEVLAEKAVLAKYPDITQTIWVVAMGVSIQIQDYVNDTCFQSTYFVKNTIDLLGIADVIGYYQLSDISEEYAVTSRILYGASGIMSRDGLQKPGFSALKLLSHSAKRLLHKEDCFMALTNGVNIVNLIVCNYSYYNETYCMSGGGETDVEKVYGAFSELETEAINISINGLAPGKYKIAVASVSREHGSLLDEWLNFGILDDLQPMDIEYLNDIVHPQRLAHYVECTDGTIEIKTQLLPHETKFYDVFRII